MIYSEVTGRLGADSELKTSKSGNQFVTMRVASNDFVGGENVTTWIRVLWSGERAVKMQEHLKKGSLVSVRGTQRVSLYDTKNGEKAIELCEKIETTNDPYMFMGLMVSQAFKKLEMRQKKAEQVIKILGDTDMNMKTSGVEPWNLIKMSLLLIANI